MSEFVCPAPVAWAAIHESLLRAREERNDASIPAPPVPLMLGAWWITSDRDKAKRWKETLAWADTYGFAAHVPAVPVADHYLGEENGPCSDE